MCTVAQGKVVGGLVGKWKCLPEERITHSGGLYVWSEERGSVDDYGDPSTLCELRRDKR